jgi:chemotaxis protein CheD
MIKTDVGIGEIVVSNDGKDIIKTYALGSCVAVIMYDKLNKVAGMIHIALPDSKVNPKKAETRPGFFADTGLPIFLDTMKKKGAVRSSTWIKLAGGSNIMDEGKTFDIGRRNAIAIKRYLWKKGLGVIKEDIGGNISRTVSISVSTGEVLISNSERKWKL